MGPNINQMNSMTIVEKLALRGRQLLHALPRKMELLKERIERSWKSPCVVLHDLGLLKFLWGEAANITVYVQNRCPHQALDFKTTKEVFIGKKPDVSHFRIFGCPVYFMCPRRKETS